MSIVIISLQLEGHKVVYIIVSLDIYVVNTCSQIKLFSFDFVKSNENIANPLTRGLSRELICNYHIGK